MLNDKTKNVFIDCSRTLKCIEACRIVVSFPVCSDINFLGELLETQFGEPCFFKSEASFVDSFPLEMAKVIAYNEIVKPHLVV